MSRESGSVDGRVRVVIADDHPIFRIGMRTLIASDPTIELVGEAEDGEETLALVQSVRPDILLLDLHLPRINGLEVLKRLATFHLDTRTVMLTGSIERGQLRTALLRGAWGVLQKHQATSLLSKCIRQVSQGEYWVARDSVGDLVDALRNPGGLEENPDGLTPREKEIVALIVTGASNKDIAWQLGLNEQTVKNHLRKVFDKLHVGNRVELALSAVERGLVAAASARIEQPASPEGSDPVRR